jgi:hypothetical protein
MIMDIRSGCGYPGNQLSNFAIHPFVFEDVEIAGMEGALQSLKFHLPHIQIEICRLTGFAAKKRGSSRNRAWKTRQTLWWKGIAMDRGGDVYQRFLDRLYLAMTEQNESFRNALVATGNSVLTHSIGKNKISETVLTEREFCSRLHLLRDLVKNARSPCSFRCAVVHFVKTKYTVGRILDESISSAVFVPSHDHTRACGCLFKYYVMGRKYAWRSSIPVFKD